MEVITPKVRSSPKAPKLLLSQYNQKVASVPNSTVPIGELEGLADIRVNIDKFK